jgi:hypothetical protein
MANQAPWITQQREQEALGRLLAEIDQLPLDVLEYVTRACCIKLAARTEG